MNAHTITLLRIIPAFLFNFLLIAVSGQTNLHWKFSQTGSNANLLHMQSDTVGNLYMIGEFTDPAFTFGKASVSGLSGNDETNVFILKLAPNGKVVYLRPVFGLESGATIQAQDMAINNRGELVMAFTVQNTTSFQLGAYRGTADRDIPNTFMAKLSKTGFLAWIHGAMIVPELNPQCMVKDLYLDEEGSTFATGYFRGIQIGLDNQTAPGTGEDALSFASRIEPDGSVMWLRSVAWDDSGDNGEIMASHIISGTNDNQFYIGGTYRGYRPFIFGSDSLKNPSGTNGFIACYTKDGNARWARDFRGDTLVYIDELDISDKGEVLALGMFTGSQVDIASQVYPNSGPGFDIFLGRFLPDGNLAAANSFPVQLPWYNYGGGQATLEVRPDDQIMLCAEFYSPNVFSDINELINPDPGSSDFLIAELSPDDLTPVWSKQGTAPGDNYYDGVKIDNQGNVFIAGTTYNPLNVDGEDVSATDPEGSPYLMALDASGNMDYAYWQSNGTNNVLNIRNVQSDGFRNSYIAGTYNGSATQLDGNSMTEAGDAGIFVAKYCRVREISGTITDVDNVPFTNGYVKLFGRTLYQRAPLADSVMIDTDGSYSFPDVPNGNYLMVVIPSDENSGNYLRTYYPNAEYWELGQMIRINPDSGPQTFNMQIIQRSELDGQTRVEGGASEAERSDLYDNKNFYKGRPAKKSTVVLVGNKHSSKASGEIVATTQTDENGNFTFQNVANGMYQLWIDVPGLPTTDVYAIEINGNSFVSNINYFITEETVEAEGVPIYSAALQVKEDPDIDIFPNPASNWLQISQRKAQVAVLDLIDIRGVILIHSRMEGSRTRLNISELPPGNYVLRILTVEGVSFEKVSVVR